MTPAITRQRWSNFLYHKSVNLIDEDLNIIPSMMDSVDQIDINYIKNRIEEFDQDNTSLKYRIKLLEEKFCCMKNCVLPGSGKPKTKKRKSISPSHSSKKKKKCKDEEEKISSTIKLNEDDTDDEVQYITTIKQLQDSTAVEEECDIQFIFNTMCKPIISPLSPIKSLPPLKPDAISLCDDENTFINQDAISSSVSDSTLDTPEICLQSVNDKICKKHKSYNSQLNIIKIGDESESLKGNKHHKCGIIQKIPYDVSNRKNSEELFSKKKQISEIPFYEAKSNVTTNESKLASNGNESKKETLQKLSILDNARPGVCDSKVLNKTKPLKFNSASHQRHLFKGNYYFKLNKAKSYFKKKNHSFNHKKSRRDEYKSNLLLKGNISKAIENMKKRYSQKIVSPSKLPPQFNYAEKSLVNSKQTPNTFCNKLSKSYITFNNVTSTPLNRKILSNTEDLSCIRDTRDLRINGNHSSLNFGNKSLSSSDPQGNSHFQRIKPRMNKYCKNNIPISNVNVSENSEKTLDLDSKPCHSEIKEYSVSLNEANINVQEENSSLSVAFFNEMKSGDKNKSKTGSKLSSSKIVTKDIPFSKLDIELTQDRNSMSTIITCDSELQNSHKIETNLVENLSSRGKLKSSNVPISDNTLGENHSLPVSTNLKIKFVKETKTDFSPNEKDDLFYYGSNRTMIKYSNIQSKKEDFLDIFSETSDSQCLHIDTRPNSPDDDVNIDSLALETNETSANLLDNSKGLHIDEKTRSLQQEMAINLLAEETKLTSVNLLANTELLHENTEANSPEDGLDVEFFAKEIDLSSIALSNHSECLLIDSRPNSPEDDTSANLLVREAEQSIVDFFNQPECGPIDTTSNSPVGDKDTDLIAKESVQVPVALLMCSESLNSDNRPNSHDDDNITWLGYKSEFKRMFNDLNCEPLPKRRTVKSKPHHSKKSFPDSIPKNIVDTFEDLEKAIFTPYNVKNKSEILTEVLTDEISVPDDKHIIFYVLKFLSLSSINTISAFKEVQDLSVFRPPIENCIVSTLMNIDSNTNFHYNDFILSVLITVHQIILSMETISVFGLCALCRVHTEICKVLKNEKAPMALCCDILKAKHKFAPMLIVSIIGVWRELFNASYDAPEVKTILFKIIAFGVLYQEYQPSYLLEMDLSSLDWNLSKNLVEKFMPYSPVFDIEDTVIFLLDSIEKKCIYVSSNELHMLTTSLVIIASCRSWKWTKFNIIDKHIVPSLEKHVNLHQNENPVILYCRLYAEICRYSTDDSHPEELLLNLFKAGRENEDYKIMENASAVGLIQLLLSRNQRLPDDVYHWLELNENNPKFSHLKLFVYRKILTEQNDFTIKDIL